MPDQLKPDQAPGSRVAYPRILQAAFEEPWMILPAKMAAIMEAIERQIVLGLPALAAYDAAAPSMQLHSQHVAGGSAYVIQIHGTIAQRMNMMMPFSGGTTTESVSRELKAALGNPDVDTILLDIASPGGSVYGIEELAQEIFDARQSKRIVAIANSQAASAAYYLGSQADEFYVTPSGEAGSIGVLGVHMDFSKFNEEQGVKPTYIFSGRYKIEGNSDEPLGDEARAFFQRRSDKYYDMFVAAVARGRGVEESVVREGFGQGRVLGAEDAVAEGLADSVRPLAGVVSDLNARAGRAARRRAHTQARPTPH